MRWLFKPTCWIWGHKWTYTEWQRGKAWAKGWRCRCGKQYIHTLEMSGYGWTGFVAHVDFIPEKVRKTLPCAG